MIEVLATPREDIDWQKCLSHWYWLLSDIPEFRVWLVTKFGELFVKVEEEIWYISTSGASIEKVADDEETFFSLMDNKDSSEFYFMPQVIEMLELHGMKINDGECYGFHIPMAFKEATLALDNFKTIDLESYLVGLGDLLGRLNESKNGEKISFKVIS